MKQEDYDFFKHNGYLSLGKILNDDEVGRFSDVFERERRDFSRFWNDNGIWQTQYCQSLLTAPEFDEIIRHPTVMEPVKVLMGDEVCFAQTHLNHMGPYEGEAIPGMTSWEGPIGRRWHRDGGERLMWPEHPLRIGYLRLMLYLSDVSATSHCLSISPESIDEEILDKEAQLARGGVSDLHGDAGTAILFNVSCLHTATVRPTKTARKTVGILYGHRHRAYLADHTYMPPSLWRDHPDEEVRGFYGVLNNKTREYLERTAGREEIPVNETLEILTDIQKNLDTEKKY